MFTALTEQQILANLHPSYHYTFSRIQSLHIQPDEKIYTAANATKTEEIEHEYTERNSWACFVILTTYR